MLVSLSFTVISSNTISAILADMTRVANVIVAAFKKTLFDHIGHRQYVTYLSNKWEHDEDTLRNEVTWPLFAKARKAARHDLCIFMSKWLVGHLPTGTVMKKWKQQLHDRCPDCQHILQLWWNTTLTSLTAFTVQWLLLNFT